MTNVGAAIAANLQRVIAERRKGGEALTDRDIERATAELGDRLVHTLVRRIRLGERERGLTVDEWLTLSLALSIPPLDLLGGEVVVGGSTHPAGRVRRWIVGGAPLNTVPDSTRYGWSEIERLAAVAGNREPSHLARRLMDAARRVDSEDSRGQRRALVSILGTLAGALEALEDDEVADRIDRRAEKGGE
ncbi:hypothetical protein ACHAAC_16085 [Aeromicrobium sp. CF4.19]|uniref:hypothetical protein n=1 Tax=Aeromicrobium sp. CF4.19 TaxID=3373082 RepID=UPI003EE4D0E1